MGQIVGGAAKPKRCNLNQLSQLGIPAAGEHILVSSDNSMNAAGQGNFDCYIEGNGQTAATALELKSIADIAVTKGSKNSVSGSGVFAFLEPLMDETISELQMSNEVANVQISNGKWTTQNSRHIYLVPYTYQNGDTLKLKANANGSYYAFLTSTSHNVGDDVPFAINGQTGWTSVAANQTIEVEIPYNCACIAINYYYNQPSGSTLFLPASVEIISKSLFDSNQVTKNKESIEQLGEKCVIEASSEQETLTAETKTWVPSTGAIDNQTIRAHLKISAKGYDHIQVVIPTGYYAQFYYVDSANVSQETITLNWEASTAEFDISGIYDIMLNIKYGSAGNTSITESMLSSATFVVTKSISAKYEAAAPYSDISSIEEELYGSSEKVTTSQFQRGSNDAQGNIVEANNRLITTDLIDMPAGASVNITANGQKYVILTYSTGEVYETSSGWITIDGTYDFQNAKKVRFVVAKTDNSVIVVSELLVDFEIKLSGGIVGDIEELKKGSEGVTTKGNDSFNVFNKTIILYNPYKNKPQNAYKGQLHCHTTNSDGADSPANVVQKYIAAGYDFMTITDHNYITPNPNVNGMVWMGDSYEDTHNSAGYQHMNVFNADAVLNKSSMYQTTNTPQMIVQHFVKDGDSVVSYNHPEYPPVYASDATLEGLPTGISFVEIFNGTIQTLIGSVATASELPSEAFYGDMYDCTGDGKRYINTSTSYSSPTWSETTSSANPDGNLDRGFRIMLDAGHKVFCNAVDDYHRGDNMFNRGWMVAFAQSKTKESIWNALLNGCSYASAGVTLTELKVENGVISLEIENGSNATTTFYKEGDVILATINGSSASYQIQGTEKYVRAMVQIGRNKAWTQPVWIIGTKNQYDF